MTRATRISNGLAAPVLVLAAFAAMASSVGAAAGDPAARLAAQVAAHREPSTIAPGFATWHLPGGHIRHDSASYSVEAVIAPAFALWRGRLPGLAGAWQLDAVPRFAVRRPAGVPSSPVFTPDDRPHVDRHYVPGRVAARWGAVFTLEHHSNGQAGPFLNADGSGPNVTDGSFSLWSVAAAWHI